MTVLSTAELDPATRETLDRFGFDEDRFERLRAGVADGSLSPAANVVRGRANGTDRIAAQLQRAVGTHPEQTWLIELPRLLDPHRNHAARVGDVQAPRPRPVERQPIADLKAIQRPLVLTCSARSRSSVLIAITSTPRSKAPT